MPPDEGEPPAQEQPAPALAPPPAQAVAMATSIQQPVEAAVMQAVDPSAAMPGMATARRGPKNSSSMYKGVTKHRRTGRWEAHIWGRFDDDTPGRQIYLGGFLTPEEAAEAHDLAALRMQGSSAQTNFDPSHYKEWNDELKSVPNDELAAAIRYKCQPKKRRTVSKYRGLTRSKNSKSELFAAGWEAHVVTERGTEVPLGTFSVEMVAAQAYDRALVLLYGSKADTNFLVNKYTAELANYARRMQAKEQLKLTPEEVDKQALSALKEWLIQYAATLPEHGSKGQAFKDPMGMGWGPHIVSSGASPAPGEPAPGGMAAPADLAEVAGPSGVAPAPADGDDTQSDEEGKGGKGKKGKRAGQGSKEGEQRGRARPRRPRYIPPTRMPGDPIPEGETQAPAVGFHNGVPGTTWGQDPAATDSSTQHPFHSRPPGAPPGPPMMGPFSPEAYQQYMQQWMAAQQQYFPGNDSNNGMRAQAPWVFDPNRDTNSPGAAWMQAAALQQGLPYFSSPAVRAAATELLPSYIENAQKEQAPSAPVDTRGEPKALPEQFAKETSDLLDTAEILLDMGLKKKPGGSHGPDLYPSPGRKKRAGTEVDETGKPRARPLKRPALKPPGATPVVPLPGAEGEPPAGGEAAAASSEAQLAASADPATMEAMHRMHMQHYNPYQGYGVPFSPYGSAFPGTLPMSGAPPSEMQFAGQAVAAATTAGGVDVPEHRILYPPGPRPRPLPSGAPFKTATPTPSPVNTGSLRPVGRPPINSKAVIAGLPRGAPAGRGASARPAGMAAGRMVGRGTGARYPYTARPGVPPFTAAAAGQPPAWPPGQQAPASRLQSISAAVTPGAPPQAWAPPPLPSYAQQPGVAVPQPPTAYGAPRKGVTDVDALAFWLGLVCSAGCLVHRLLLLAKT